MAVLSTWLLCWLIKLEKAGKKLYSEKENMHLFFKLLCVFFPALYGIISYTRGTI